LPVRPEQAASRNSKQKESEENLKDIELDCFKSFQVRQAFYAKQNICMKRKDIKSLQRSIISKGIDLV
jgi:hypothetical protein